MDEFEKEIKEDFLSEARDLLDSAEGSFLNLESNPNDPELLNEIFRLAHNLKGTSKAVGFDKISEFTHSAENLILKIQNGEIQATKAVVSILLEFKDYVDLSLTTLSMDLNADIDCGGIVQKIEDIISGKIEPNDQGNSQENPTSEKVSRPQEEMSSKVEQESNVVNIQDEKVNEENLNQNNTQQSKPQTVKRPQQKTNPNEDIRVKLARINAVNDYIGELVILQTALDQRRGIHIEDELSNNAISQMSKIFKELQDLAMSLRMIPLTNTFQKMRRIVRDTSQALSKEIDLQILGEETEVDKKVLESLGDPLVHIVRNAVDHGIESTETRIQNGKEAVGTVEINAFHEGSKLVILITDDGGGIPAEKIRQKAIERGLISNEDVSDEQIIQYIFHPGLSTKDEVSEVSGRGVGMDVVKTNIENLGGTVKVMTKKGQGSCFRIELPLTLAIVDGLVILSEKQKYALPLGQVQEIISLDNKQIIQMTGGGKFFKHRNKVLPFFDLRKKLNQEVNNDFNKTTTILVKGPEGFFGVSVDDILNKQQVVIKTLSEDIQSARGFMGGTILGDGKPALIIDLVEMYKDDYKVKLKTKNDNLDNEMQAA